jgi:hypothetical protein
MKKTATIMYIPEEIEDGSEFELLNNMFQTRSEIKSYFTGS